MPSGKSDSGPQSTLPLVRPFLNALSRMQQKETLHPVEMAQEALQLLNERLGPSEQHVVTAFAPSGVGIMAEHTHFFDGFGLVMPLPYGVAVALRKRDQPSSRAVMAYAEEMVSFEIGAWEDAGRAQPSESWACTIEGVTEFMRREGLDVGALDVAVVSSIPTEFTDSYLGSLGVAVALALQKITAQSLDQSTVARICRRAIAHCLQRPYGAAYPLAGLANAVDQFLLMDTSTLEHLPVEIPSRERLGCGLVNTRAYHAPAPDFHKNRQAEYQASMAILRRNGFPELESLRDLEHKDLQTALRVLPAQYIPVVRHMVRENGRVQKLVAALRRADWHVFGALLLMSHASLRDEWQSSTPEANFVVGEVENAEGMYGARMVGGGFGGFVLIVGQPFTVPRFLDAMARNFEAHFGYPPETVLL